MQTLMAQEEIRVTIDPAHTGAIRQMIQERTGDTPDQCVNTILEIYLASRAGEEQGRDDLGGINELLRLRIADLEHQLKKKEEALSVLLELWEHCIMKTESTPEEESRDIDDRVARLIRDWYYDSERKDHSGTDGGAPGHV